MTAFYTGGHAGGLSKLSQCVTGTSRTSVHTDQKKKKINVCVHTHISTYEYNKPRHSQNCNINDWWNKICV